MPAVPKPCAPACRWAAPSPPKPGRDRACGPAWPGRAGTGKACASPGCTRRRFSPTCATTAAACCASRRRAPARCCPATSAGMSKPGWRSCRRRRCAATCWWCHTTAATLRRAWISWPRCGRRWDCCRSATTTGSACPSRSCSTATSVTARRCSTAPAPAPCACALAATACRYWNAFAATARATGAMPQLAAQAMLSASPQRQR